MTGHNEGGMALLVKIEIIDWEKKHANEMTFPFYREGYFGIRKKIRLYQKADATIGESSETLRFRIRG